MSALLDIRGLTVHFAGIAGRTAAVNGVDFRIEAGETLALLGESGSGKSVTALSLTRLLPAAAVVGGYAGFQGQDLLTFSKRRMQALRGRHIAMIFQEPQTSLNPALTVGLQVGETLARHWGLRTAKQRRKVIELLDSVGIPEPHRRRRDYPHQFSGGMKQRVMLAIALAGEPALLIADEPTTALDVTTQARALDLLKEIQANTGMALLFITHDLAVAAQVADRVAVMQAGRIVETGAARQFFNAPEHAYSKQLLAAVPDATKLFVPVARATSEPALRVAGLQVRFPVRSGFLRRVTGCLCAVDDVSLTLARGRTLAVVGESGCGKTTLAKAILRLLEPVAGAIYMAGEDLLRLSPAQLRRRRTRIQVVFQDPFSSMNPRMMVKDIIEEGMLALDDGASGAQRQQRVDSLLLQMGLDVAHKFRYPHEFSGGQRQRICIARALAVRPELLVLDEPTSALDVTVQAMVLKLLAGLQQELALSYLFITHDLSIVAGFAHEVAVMRHGRIVEQGETARVLQAPRHEYTQALLAAAPTLPGSGRRAPPGASV